GDPRPVLGRAAEEGGAKLLERAGLRIVARNIKLRHGEIDLVCRDREVWVFVEVKCRQARWDDGPGAAVSWWKRRRLIRLAQHYLKWMHLTGARCRFDVVGVTPPIFVQLEWYGASGSLKDRIYLHMFERAEARGDLRAGMRVLECSTGNAGIACAFVAAVKGYRCTIVMPEGLSEERKKITR